MEFFKFLIGYLTPTMPQRHFSVLVKSLKENNVRLFERREDDRTGRDFVHFTKTKAVVLVVGAVTLDSSKRNQKVTELKYYIFHLR